MSIGPTLLPFVTAQGLGVPSQAGAELEPMLELDLPSLHQQLDQELNGEGSLPVVVVEQLVDLFRSVEGEALPEELQGVLQKLQAVAEAGAQSPLLDPVAGGLGEQPRIEVAALLAAPIDAEEAPRAEGLPTSLAELVDVQPSSELQMAERVPHLDPAVRLAPTPDAPLLVKAEVTPSGSDQLVLADLEPLAEPLDALPAQEAGADRARAVAVESPGSLAESPGSLAESAPPAPLQAAVPTLPAEVFTAPVAVSEPSVVLSTAPARAVPSAPLPVRGAASNPSGPSTLAAPAGAPDGGGATLLDPVEVVSRSTAKATTTVAASTARPVGSGTFDGTPWLMTESQSRAAAPVLAPAPGVESADPEQLPEPSQHRPAPATRSAKGTGVARPLRSPITPAGQATLAPEGALQGVAGDASSAQATDITRPALSASRGPALSSQLTQAAQASAPDAPVTHAERPLQQVAVRVRDGERTMRLGVVRESEGYAVEVRAPRDMVTEIRDMEADVDAALREDGDEGLASFDAFADDEPFEGPDFFDEEVESEPVGPSEEEPYHDSSRLLDRRA